MVPDGYHQKNRKKVGHYFKMYTFYGWKIMSNELPSNDFFFGVTTWDKWHATYLERHVRKSTPKKLLRPFIIIIFQYSMLAL
jgi:hypothetical protein